MRTWRYSWWMRMTGMVVAATTTGLVLATAPAQAQQMAEINRLNKPHMINELGPGLTQCLTPAQWKAVDARRAQEQAEREAHKPDVRVLSLKEMRQVRGRGVSYRNKYFTGNLPWFRSLRDVNLCDGNLFKSFTDIQVKNAVGAGLALQRTYNSDDPRIGPFGQGWTHAYDIRNEEENPTDNETDPSLNYSDRTDFFAAKHKYHRDADGLYSPPPYLFDEMSSDYAKFLVNGPITALDDTDISMDGTIKHFTQNGSIRSCDYIQDRCGNRTTLVYDQTTTLPDGSHPLLTVTDPSNRTLTFHTTNLGSQQQPVYRVTQVDGPLYSVTYSYTTDGLYNLYQVTLDPGTGHLNRTTTFGYTSYNDGQGNTENGLLASITDPLGHVVSYQYSVPTNVTGTLWVTSITEPAGVIPNTTTQRTQTWTLTPAYELSGDWSGTIQVPWNNGNNVSGILHADPQLRKVGYEVGTSGAWDYNSYDSANNLISQTNVESEVNYGQGLVTRTDNYTFGPHGNVLTHTINGFSGTETTTYYNASQYFQKQSFIDMNGHITTWGVGTNSDPNVGNRGSILWMQDAGYNDPNSPSYQKQYTYSYNSYGQKVSETNLNGVVTNYTYGDQWGNLTQIVQDPGTGHLNRTTSMEYDAAGHVLQCIDPANLTSTLSYNVLGQPTAADFPATANTPAETISYFYDANGRTNSVDDNRGTTSVSYEPGSDRVSSVTDPVTGTVSYTYTLSGERNTMSLPGGGTWTYTYGTQGPYAGCIFPKDDPNELNLRLANIVDNGGRKVEYRFLWSGELLSSRTNETYSGSTLTSYMEADYTYDSANGGQYSRGWLQQVNTNWNHLSNGVWKQSTLAQNVYSLDNTGQRLTNQITDNMGATRTETYGYDDLDRLSSVNYGDGQTQSYQFDAMGNRLQKQDSANGTENYTYNNANMLLTRGTNNYSNDLDGNTLSGGGRTNTWDSENRLAQCVYSGNTCVYTYGSDGQRRRGVVNGIITDYVLDGSMFVRELRSGSNYATYLLGPRGPEYRHDDVHNTIRWYVYDGLGSVLEEVGASGTVTASRKYDVYGSLRSSTGTGTSKHEFVGKLGHPSEAETGMIYMQARYMDPVTGRFISEDPGTHGFNWYVYCDNNPICRADANGKFWGLIIGALLTGIWALLGRADDYGWLPPFWSKLFNTLDALASGFAFLMEALTRIIHVDLKQPTLCCVD